MPAFEWVHVQLHQQKGMISLSPPTICNSAELAKAFAYALNQWPALTYYADDGWAEADNNIAENALRMVSLG
ncbi:IS66 family transposase, partial [Escherichia coli]|uniref:IS66 family transposase n=1 Tax=Escherichia coli TaxID=562 RepID=UPI003F4ECD86